MKTKKVCIVGGLGVGKTSLVQRFINGEVSDKSRVTVGVNIESKQICIDGDHLKLLISDVEGKSKCRSLPMIYLQGASAIIYVVDGTRVDTLTAAMDIKLDFERHFGISLPGIMLFNKADLVDQWEVSNEMISNVGAGGMLTLLTSSKQGSGVDIAFDLISRVLMGKTSLVAA